MSTRSRKRNASADKGRSKKRQKKDDSEDSKEENKETEGKGSKEENGETEELRDFDLETIVDPKQKLANMVSLLSSLTLALPLSRLALPCAHPPSLTLFSGLARFSTLLAFILIAIPLLLCSLNIQ
jgi:hypothetical protein